MQEALWQRVKEGLVWFDGGGEEEEEQEEEEQEQEQEHEHEQEQEQAKTKGKRCRQRSGFEEAMARHYPRFRVIGRESLPSTLPDSTRRALQKPKLTQQQVLKDELLWFRRDYVWVKGKVTQTMVTRLLVGERGCTYKYKGLRLFCRSWDTAAEASPGSADEALAAIRGLNDVLKERSKSLHESLEGPGGGGGRGGGGEGGGGGGEHYEFNATLINYFDEAIADHVETRLEPYYGMGQCCISWHADDGVVEGSAIAVYNVIECSAAHVREQRGGEWKVGLKVKWEVDTPGVAVPMADGDGYVMLSGFNEKNQHCVVCGRGSRFSSTHRVCPQGDMYPNFLHRCQQTLDLLLYPWHVKSILEDGSDRRASLKRIEGVLDSLQDLHDELEFEWLRQFHFQNNDLPPGELDLYWNKAMQGLADFWQRMETFVWTWISCCNRKSWVVGGQELRDRLEHLREVEAEQGEDGCLDEEEAEEQGFFAHDWMMSVAPGAHSSSLSVMRWLVRSERGRESEAGEGKEEMPDDVQELARSVLVRRLKTRQEHRAWWQENYRRKVSMARGGEHREGGKRKRRDGRSLTVGCSLLPANLHSIISTLR